MSEETNPFEIATRRGLTFKTTRGELSIETLWTVPLRARGTDDFSLDAIGKGLRKQLKETETAEESLVDQGTPETKEEQDLKVRFAVVKRMIDVKLAEEGQKKKKDALKAEETRLLELLDRAKNKKMEGLSEEEIQARLTALKTEQASV